MRADGGPEVAYHFESVYSTVDSRLDDYGMRALVWDDFHKLQVERKGIVGEGRQLRTITFWHRLESRHAGRVWLLIFW